MDGTHPFLIKLQAILAALDDDALAALANRGLLRRARKDLESNPPTILKVEENSISLQVSDAVVTVPELPSHSHCSCPAAGICRHILAALVYVREASSLAISPSAQQSPCHVKALPAIEQPSNRTPEDVLGAATEEEIQSWAGKAVWKKALTRLASGPRVEIEATSTLVVRFPSLNLTCRWIPGGGLDGMYCSCQSGSVCVHIVMAVVAYRASLGKQEIQLEQRLLEESSGAPRSRAEVLHAVGSIIQEMISTGLTRLSSATTERLTTLAVSAHGVDLPRLERTCKTLANEIQRSLQRDAQASSVRLLSPAARLEALRAALERNARPEFIGQHRSTYDDIGQLYLIGLGARYWISKGGYHGLTVYFWEESSRTWATWSDLRPVQQAGFDPISRFGADGPWPGCDSPHKAGTHRLRLSNAGRNPQGRLSGRATTRALILSPTHLEDVPDRITEWSELAQRARRFFSGGLIDQTQNQAFVLLVPSEWMPATYDPVRQELSCPLLDEHGRMIPLWLPFSAETEIAIECLEKLTPQKGDGVLGELRLVAGQLRVQPISLITGSGVISLNLPDAKRPSTKQRQQKQNEENSSVKEESLDEDDPAIVDLSGAATPLGRLLIAAQAELEAIAEGGIAIQRDFHVLETAARRFETLGLSTCAYPLQRLANALQSSSRLADQHHRQQTAGDLLHAYYLLRMASDQETLALACSGLG